MAHASYQVNIFTSFSTKVLIFFCFIYSTNNFYVFRLKRKIKTPKISGIPKVKKKAATIAKNPFKSNSERNFEKNWLKKYSPRVKLDKKFEKGKCFILKLIKHSKVLSMYICLKN